MLGERPVPHHVRSLTALIGSFVALYRCILNALPVLFPANITLRENLRKLFASLSSNQDEEGDDFVLGYSPDSSPAPTPPHIRRSPVERREARLSTSAQVHQNWVRRKTRRWHAVLAGAIAGVVAISFEKRSRRNVIAQQLFVRYVSVPSLEAPINYCLTVGCRAHTMLTRKNVVSIFHMVTFWSLHWRTSLFFNIAPLSDVRTGVGRSHMHFS
jgi:hypothetical protein